MRTSTILLLGTSAVLTSCHPQYWGPSPPHFTPPSCLTESDASFLVNNFIDHIAMNFNQTWGDRLIADNATVTCQSVNALMGRTGAALQGPTSVGKQAVLDDEHNKAFKLDIKLISIDTVSCNSIAFRWWGIPQDSTPVRAISIFNTVKSAQHGWQIKTIYGEFNSLTWAEDLGAKLEMPPPPPET